MSSQHSSRTLGYTISLRTYISFSFDTLRGHVTQSKNGSSATFLLASGSAASGFGIWSYPLFQFCDFVVQLGEVELLLLTHVCLNLHNIPLKQLLQVPLSQVCIAEARRHTFTGSETRCMDSRYTTHDAEETRGTTNRKQNSCPRIDLNH